VTNVDKPPEQAKEPSSSRTLAASFALKQRAGGIAVPAVTVVIAFLMAGEGLSQRDLAKMLHIEGPTLPRKASGVTSAPR